jgi:hypothetical protein
MTAKATDDGIDSDHSAVSLDLILTSIKFKERTVSRSEIDWRKIASNDRHQIIYNGHLTSLTTPDMDFTEFNASILQAGELTANVLKEKCKGWFQFSRDMLNPLLTKQNQLLHTFRCSHNLSDDIVNTIRADLRRAQRRVNDAVSLAKSKWYADLCQKIHDMGMNPRLAWEHIRMLMGGKSAHHNKIKNMAMRLPDGRLAKNAAENMSVMYPHFQRVFNNHRPTNSTILELVPQQRTMWELNDPITWDEFSRADRKLKNGKATGLTNVSPEAFKAMSNGNHAHVFNFINAFLEGSADYKEWHCS